MKITEESLKETQQPALSPQAPLHEKPKSEREKLRSMPKKDRIWYIWAYYKFHMLAVVIAIVVVCGIGSAVYQKSFDTALYCVYLNNRSEAELDATLLEEGFSEYLGLGAKERIITESSYISFGDNATEFSYASMAKITALVASKELDILIGDREGLEHYASVDGMADLETELPEEMLRLIRDRLVYTSGDDGGEYAYGVSLAGTWFAEESHLAQDPPILGIISNSTHKDTVIALLNYIFAR